VEGTELTGRIIIKNPTEKDIEVINAALMAAQDNGIGGWTRRGKGRVKFEVTAKKVKRANYKEQGAAEAKRLVSMK